MKRKIFTVLAMIGMTAALAAPAQASGAGEPDFSAEAIGTGLTAEQAADLQDRVDEILAAIPGGEQVSATEISYDGLDVIVDPLSTDSSDATAVSCSDGWFCIDVRGTRFNFYKCQTWELSDWWGVSPYNNNQTSGTVARAYGQNGDQVFSNTAKSNGSIDTVSWWSFRPC